LLLQCDHNALNADAILLKGKRLQVVSRKEQTMSEASNEIPDQVRRVVNFVPMPFLDALLLLHSRRDLKGIDWALGGNFAEFLKIIKVDFDSVEIVATKKNAERIFEAVHDFFPSSMAQTIHRLDRKARISGAEYPVYIKSYFFEFKINKVSVKVYGDMQYQINGWDWGEKLEFTPEFIYVVGHKTALIPLFLKIEKYQMLGWNDRVEKIQAITRKPSRNIEMI
jgi:hypothetical protein